MEGGKTKVLLKLEKIQKAYRDGRKKNRVLDSVNMEIHARDYIAIQGRSGSGKTTLLNIMGAMVRPDQGKLLFGQNDLAHAAERELAEYRRKQIGFVIQRFHLLKDRNVFENIKLPLKYEDMQESKRKRLVGQALEMMGMESYASRFTDQLSGGEQQRVAIARAIIKRPSLLLADEPTGALDEETEAQILDIFDLLHENGMTIVMVTHDGAVAERCTKRYQLRNGGLIRETGKPSEPELYRETAGKSL